MSSITARRTLLSGSAALFLSASALAQIPFTEIATIDLNLTATAGSTSFIGTNPAAIAWDGTDLYVAGYNNSPTALDVGIVRVTDALNTATLGTTFGLQAATPSFRGYSGLDIAGGVLAASYDDGGDHPQGITNWMPNGTLVWAHLDRGSSGAAFDPDFPGGSGGSGTGFLQFSSGRRSLNDAAGSVVFDTTNGMIITPGGGSLWRSLDFDDATGDVYMRRANDVVRATRTGSNSCTPSLIVDNLENGAFIAQQNVAFIDSTAFGDLVIYNDRPASGPNQGFEFIVFVVDSDGNPVNFDFGTFTPATGNGAYDFSWDPGSETLAILDFANRNAHIFMLGTPAPNLTDACSGDGGDQMGCTSCPCGNDAPQGSVGGCINSAGVGARLLPSGSPSVTAPEPTDLRMEMSGGVPASFAVLTSGNSIAPANAANPCFGQDSGVQSSVLDGLRCAVQSTQRHGGRPVDANGDVGVTGNGWGGASGPQPNLAAQGGFVAGQTRHYQVFYRELPGMVCGTEQNTSQAVSVTFEP